MYIKVNRVNKSGALYTIYNTYTILHNIYYTGLYSLFTFIWAQDGGVILSQIHQKRFGVEQEIIFCPDFLTFLEFFTLM